jgi:hypothetical protein
MEVLLSDAVIEHKGRKITPGLMVTNSETGHSSLWIEPIVEIDGKYIFASRMNAYSEYRKFRQIHKGEGLKPEEITETVKCALEAAQIGAVQYMEGMDVEVKPEKVLDFVKTIDALPKRFVGLWEDQWKQEEKIKKEKAMREILTAAAELPILGRIAVEQAAGKWYGMFERYTNRFVKLKEQKQKEMERIAANG